MSIVSKITRAIFPAREKRTITVVAKYDAAQTTAENAAHWSQATAWDADTEASSDVRATLRSRSRYETANNPWIAGMVKTQAYDIIGTGPRLQVLSDKSKLNNAIEAPQVQAPIAPKQETTIRTETGTSAHSRKPWKHEIVDVQAIAPGAALVVVGAFLREPGHRFRVVPTLRVRGNRLQFGRCDSHDCPRSSG